MLLSRPLIKDFRNIENVDLALSPGFSFLADANGSDKTSVLETIYTFGHDRTFHSLQIGRAIRHEQESFVLHGRLQGEGREASIGLTKDRLGDSKMRIDGTDGYKVAESAHLMPMQLITSEGFTLLSGGPKYRRAFLDWGCFHNEVGLLTAWSNLKWLLKQRNVALCQVSRYGQLRPWDKELIPPAKQTSIWRAEYNAGIAQGMADTCQQSLPEFSLSFSFQHGWEKETDYAEVLERSFECDRTLTYTAHDSYKADSRIHADGVPVKDMLSCGQLKLLMCALRLVQREFLIRESGRYCLYLINDFASELDNARRGLLASCLKAAQSQVLVNAISAEHAIDMSDENSKMFTVEKGKMTD